jgi:hypothetical protein
MSVFFLCRTTKNMWKPFQGKGYELGGRGVLLTPPLMKERRADELERRRKKMDEELKEKREKEKKKRKIEQTTDANTKTARMLNYDHT